MQGGDGEYRVDQGSCKSCFRCGGVQLGWEAKERRKGEMGRLRQGTVGQGNMPQAGVEPMG